MYRPLRRLVAATLVALRDAALVAEGRALDRRFGGTLQRSSSSARGDGGDQDERDGERGAGLGMPDRPSGYQGVGDG